MSSIASLTRWPCLAVVLGLALGAAERSGAQLLTNHSFNIVLAGDDPGEVFTFVLPGNAFMPSFARFDGFFDNLDPFETGVRYGLHWTGADTGVFLDALGIDFTRLPGSGRLPVQFVKWLWFTPQTVMLHVEGGGPVDRFRFVGNLTIEQASSPSIATCRPPPAILGWWPADLVTNDIIGNRHAILRGGAAFGPALVREAFALNGNQQFVEVLDDGGLNVGTKDFTFELWVRFDNPDGEQVIAEKYVERMSEGSEGWTITKLPNNTIRFALGGGANLDSPPPETIATGAWTHMAVRRSGRTFTTFQNGSVTASGDFTVNLDNMSSLKFGHRGNPSDTPGSADTRDFWLHGAIDEPSFYSRALTDQEIASIFQARAAGKCRRPIVLTLTPPSTGAVRAAVRGVPGLPHVLEGSTDLIHWSALITNIPTTEVFQLEAVDAPATHRFYRAAELR